MQEGDKLFRNDKVLESVDVYMNVNSWQKILGLTEDVFIEQIKGYLSQGNYIWGSYNERYISGKIPYQRYDYNHDYLLYGYDDEKGGFISAAYMSDGVYREFILPYSEYYQGIFQPHFTHHLLSILRFNKEKTYELDLTLIREGLVAYLESRRADRRVMDNESTYGLESLKVLIDHFEKWNNIDLRAARAYMEYRGLMYKRLKYLSEMKIISDDLADAYLPTSSNAEKVYLLSIKHNMTGKTALKSKCIDYIQEAIDSDKKILPQVVSQIEQYLCEGD
jgi:hypothetical protein